MWGEWRSLLTQQQGFTTVRVISRPGRITQAAHVFVIVRNLISSAAADKVGRVRLLPVDESGQQACTQFCQPDSSHFVSMMSR